MFRLSSVSHCNCLQVFSEGWGWHGKRRCTWRWCCLFLLEVTLFYWSLFNFFCLSLALRIGTPPQSVCLTAFVLGFVRRLSTICSGKTRVWCALNYVHGKGLSQLVLFRRKWKYCRDCGICVRVLSFEHFCGRWWIWIILKKRRIKKKKILHEEWYERINNTLHGYIPCR